MARPSPRVRKLRMKKVQLMANETNKQRCGFANKLQRSAKRGRVCSWLLPAPSPRGDRARVRKRSAAGKSAHVQWKHGGKVSLRADSTVPIIDRGWNYLGATGNRRLFHAGTVVLPHTSLFHYWHKPSWTKKKKANVLQQHFSLNLVTDYCWEESKSHRFQTASAGRSPPPDRGDEQGCKPDFIFSLPGA